MKTLTLTFILSISVLTVFSQKDLVFTSVCELDKVFTKTEKEPRFPGGAPAFTRFIGRNMNLKNLQPYLKETPQTVVVKFIIDCVGLISRVELVNSKDIDPVVGEEAMKLIKRGPKWEPAVQNRRNVVYQHIQPIPIPSKTEADSILQGRVSLDAVFDSAFRRTKVTTTSYVTLETSERIFTKAEQPAAFPGGVEALQQYIENNFNRQKLAPHLKEPQTLMLSCIIDTVGNVSRVGVLTKKTTTKDGTKVEENFGPINRVLVAELVRLINAGPKWIPARQRGKTVMFRVLQSITFPRYGGADIVKFAP